jgi:soluble P-type ATPase
MIYNVPEVGEIEIKTIVFDLNGTLQVNGVVPEGLKERMEKLKSLGFKLVFFSGDVRGNAPKVAHELGIDFISTFNAEDKEREFLKFDTNTTAAVGNARIDIGTFKHAVLSIATLQSEGIHIEILKYVDVIVPHINDALDFFINEGTFKGTMRR